MTMTRGIRTTSPWDRDRSVELLARFVSGAGLAALGGGAVAWLAVRSQLARERISVPGSADWLPGRAVRGPVAAVAEAEAIRRMSLEATGGRTYGELGEDEPVAQMAMDAALLRSSLFTSVMAFGVAAVEMILGGVLMVIGSALARLSNAVTR